MKSLAGELFLITGNTMDTITQQRSHLAVIPGKAAVAVGPGGLLRDKNGTIATSELCRPSIFFLTTQCCF